jgi:hypothetical protein
MKKLFGVLALGCGLLALGCGIDQPDTVSGVAKHLSFTSDAPPAEIIQDTGTGKTYRLADQIFFAEPEKPDELLFSYTGEVIKEPNAEDSYPTLQIWNMKFLPVVSSTLNH